MNQGKKLPYFLITLAIVARFLPHPFGVTPIGALGLFAGSYCHPKIAWTVPLIALAVGDLLGGGYNLTVLVCVYLGFLGGPLLGRLFLNQKRSAVRFIGATFGAAVIFFIVSNFGNWLVFRPLTVNGLIQCYLDGLPYFRTTLIGDLVYGAILFGAAGWAQRYRQGQIAADND